MSDCEQELAILAEFGKCLDHILESVNKLRNLQYPVESYRKDISSPSMPHYLDAHPLATEQAVKYSYPQMQACPPSGFSNTITSEIPIAMPYPVHHMTSDAFYPADLQCLVSADQAVTDYTNLLVSAEAPEASMAPPEGHYLPVYQAALSPDVSGPSNVFEISAIPGTMKPTFSIPYDVLSPTPSVSHHLPPPQPHDQPLLVAPPHAGDEALPVADACYPLTLSTEADFAAAAISAEVSGGGVINIDDECLHPNAMDPTYFCLSTPFDLVSTEF
ncbi:unnamed protein product [Mesocestoides corti]|uniref:Uncharacterized protein n=2 Tax=Mesocestoides corti TaxID=53468 RepID=A0A0R3UH27_MESCO|nr:unnamed protein product [Mesocestoides corti]